MHNHVTNVITAAPNVIKSMINHEGVVDFNKVLPFNGPNDFDGIDCSAEEAAEIICGIPVSDWMPLGGLQSAMRKRFDIRTLDERQFMAFVKMVENYRACGYLHAMHFARKEWGTKWNAYEQTIDIDHKSCRFDTAWSCPIPLLKKLSRDFPDDDISVVFADEDIGSNCGKFTLRNGKMIDKDIAPPWADMNDIERAKWSKFACDVKGIDESELEDQS